ncbi:MAG: extracellular solute-binding protein [Desulfobacterales bacterium]|nr:extracellular solute-binding protein [Desulfobacterales bacterium]
MFTRKCARIGWSLTLILGVVLAASAAAQPAPDALVKVIEGAKKEGTVTVILSPEYGEESMTRLEKEIRERFGVALAIKYTPSGRMSKALATAIMEHKMGATPSYDLEYYSANNIITGNRAGIFEQVDWKALMTKDTPPEGLLPAPFNAPVTSTTDMILMYNPDKVSDDAVPRTLSELADPKWKGKVGVYNYPSKWSKWWLILGKDKGQAAIQAILKNGAFQGGFSDLANRFLIGEIWMAITQSNYLLVAQSKGVPAKWVALRDLVEADEGAVAVRKGAKNPNAAKLVAVYLASPAGSKFTLETAKYGNIHIPGNLDHDIVVEAKKQQIPVFFVARDPKFVEFASSKKYQDWMKEVRLTFETWGSSKSKKKK